MKIFSGFSCVIPLLSHETTELIEIKNQVLRKLKGKQVIYLTQYAAFSTVQLLPFYSGLISRPNIHFFFFFIHPIDGSFLIFEFFPIAVQVATLLCLLCFLLIPPVQRTLPERKLYCYRPSSSHESPNFIFLLVLFLLFTHTSPGLFDSFAQ